MKNLFNPSQPLPKKFMMHVAGTDYICNVEDDNGLTCTLYTLPKHRYSYNIDDIMHFFTDNKWIIPEIIEPYSIEYDFSNCYIDVKAFAEANNIQIETAHYIIQPWLFSLGKDWGSCHKQTIFLKKSKMLVFEGNRICWEDADYKEERDEMCLSYSPVDGITYVIVPFKKSKIKRSGWVNVYEDNSVSVVFDSLEDAKKSINYEYIVDTVEINWEE